MVWKEVAYGNNLEEFEDSLNRTSVPHGTSMILEINAAGAGWLDNWAGEWMVQRMLSGGAIVEDVVSDGWDKAKVYMTAQSVLIPIIIAIVAIAAVFFIYNLRLIVEVAEGEIDDWSQLIKWGVIGGLGIGALIILTRRR